MSQLLGKQVLAPAGQGFQDFVKPPALLTAVNGVPGAGQFRSEIVGRAPMSDLANDLMLRMGRKRIPAQAGFVLEDETGPNGEPVFAIPNDIFGQIRFAGTWINQLDANGVKIRGGAVNDFIEIVFFGTHINIYTFPFAMDWRVTVDGGAESANIVPPSLSTITSGRNYPSNVVIPVVSNLSLGIHTVKIRLGASTATPLHGFEFFTVNPTPEEIRTNPGSSFIKGIERVLPAFDSQNFKTGFENGTLGIKGGNVLVYQKADGTIAKSVNPTDAVQGDLGAANHDNEDIIRSYFPSEFGAGRSDDWSNVGGVIDRAFLLEDGTTSLVGDNVGVIQSGGDTVIDLGTAGDSFTFTFVGTGFDFVRVDSATGSPNIRVIVDNVDIGALSVPGIQAKRTDKMVSGLPFGTHTVKIDQLSGGFAPFVSKLIIYGPKLPDLPADTQKIGSYFINADFVANTVAGLGTIATGVIRKGVMREVLLSGTWFIGGLAVTSFINGFDVETFTNGGFFQTTFFGTGFEARFSITNGRTDTSLVELSTDGGLTFQTFNTANFPDESAAATTYGTGAVYTAATGNLDMKDGGTTAAGGFSVSGLPLKVYTLRITNGTTDAFSLDLIDIITPIHAPIESVDPLLNTLPIGSTGLKDLRNFSPLRSLEVSGPNVATAEGFTDQTTTSTVFIPMAQMVSIIRMDKPGIVKITGIANLHDAVGAGNPVMAIFLNGKRIGRDFWADASLAGQPLTVTGLVYVRVAAGIQMAQIYFKANSLGTISSLASTLFNVRSVAIEEMK